MEPLLGFVKCIHKGRLLAGCNMVAVDIKTMSCRENETVICGEGKLSACTVVCCRNPEYSRGSFKQHTAGVGTHTYGDVMLCGKAERLSGSFKVPAAGSNPLKRSISDIFSMFLSHHLFIIYTLY